MQMIITYELSKEEYFWLYNLRNDLKAGKEIEDVAVHYEPNKHSKLYQAVMNAIVRGNRKEMEVAREMCEALYELFEDELKERERKGISQGISQGIEALIESLQEFGQSFDSVRKKIIEKFSITDEEADDYMKKYWK